MNTREEKLSMLSQMIALAKVDGVVKDSEYELLLIIADQMEIDKLTFDNLFDKEAPYIALKPESERILQFHRLVLLMNVDGENEEKEMEAIHKFGLKMGLNLNAVKTVLKIMTKYPNHIVPPNVLIDIFKAQHN